VRCSHLKDPSRAYFRVLALISMALRCLGWDNNLVDVYRVIILY